MCKKFKPISISLSPNTEKDDIRLALKLLFLPWKWKKGVASRQLEEAFKKYLGVKYAFSFNSGRTSMMAALNALNLEKGTEVLTQAFTCNAAVNPILWQGLNPVYVDCDKDTFNIDANDLQRKITRKSAAVMVQHTFGQPADMAKVSALTKQRNLALIEDCAHSLGAEFNEKKVGTMGDVAFFSFGRDKIISSVYGGMAVTNDDELAEKMKAYQEKIKYPGFCWTMQQLLHPVLMNCLILPTYDFLGFGKIILVIFQKLGILSKVVSPKEKKGAKPYYFPLKMPNALAVMAIHQLEKLERFNNHRQNIADFYYQTLKDSDFVLPKKIAGSKNVFLRYTVKSLKAHWIIKKAWKKNILIGDWYTSPIIPVDTNLQSVNYKAGSCPNAEEISKTSFNLPTHVNVTINDAGKITDFLKTLK